jgi:hypothetical protein
MNANGIIKLRNYTQVVYWRFLVLPHLYNGFWGNSTRGNFDFFKTLEIQIDKNKPGIENATTNGNSTFDLTRIIHYDLTEAINLGKLSLLLVKERHIKPELLKQIFKAGSYIEEEEWNVELLELYLQKVSKKFNLRDIRFGLEWFLQNLEFLDKFNKEKFTKTKVGDELEDISKIIKSANNTINQNPVIRHSLESGYEPKDINRIKEYVKEAGNAEKAIEYISKEKLPLFKDKHKVQRRANAAKHLGYQEIYNLFANHLNIMESKILSFEEFLNENWI